MMSHMIGENGLTVAVRSESRGVMAYMRSNNRDFPYLTLFGNIHWEIRKRSKYVERQPEVSSLFLSWMGV